MRLLPVLLNLLLLICPCALCYGQFSFSSITGKGGYAAMKGYTHLFLDNGITIVPSGGYYRPSDSEEDEQLAMGKAGMQLRYDAGNKTTLFIKGDFVPRHAGFQRFSYQVGLDYQICYHCGVFKNLQVRASAGQVFYDITRYVNGNSYPGGFYTQTPLVIGYASTEIGKMLLQVQYEKLIKYSHRPAADIASKWTDIPFMTAVVQGFVSDVAVSKVSYRTRWLSPYAVYARYKYIVEGKHMDAWGAGMALHWNTTTVSGGIESFESSWENARRNYFSLSASTEF